MIDDTVIHNILMVLTIFTTWFMRFPEEMIDIIVECIDSALWIIFGSCDAQHRDDDHQNDNKDEKYNGVHTVSP